MAASSATPSAMRYQANGANPGAPDETQKRLDDEQRGDERHRQADGDLERPRRRQLVAHLEQIVRECGSHRRHGEEERKLGRGGPVEPIIMPPTIVAPDRDTPGISASVWHTPMPNARGSGVCSASHDDGRRTHALDDQHDDAADDERHGKHARALVQDALDEVGEEARRRAAPEWWPRRSPRRNAAPPARNRGPRATSTILRAIQPHDREDRSELNHDGEDAAGIVVARPLRREQQMRGGGDRQEFRDSLHDSEQRRS